MPGRRRTNFRQGDLAEDLGILLLKGIAVVADVPREEDVGLDAIASLLRRDQDGNCYAEDSFVVQFKSESTETIDYRDHELTWFLGQSQPMFIGRVSLKKSRIALYPTLFVNQAVLALHATQVTVRFGISNVPSLSTKGPSPWVGGPGRCATVWLGSPLLEWTMADFVGTSWQQTAYEVLKRFLPLARREIELLFLNQCSDFAWTTNDKDSIASSLMMGKGHAANIKGVVQQCLPGLQSLLILATGVPEQSGNPLLVTLLSLISVLRDLGAEIDPDNPFLKLGSAMLSRRVADSAIRSQPESPGV